MGKYLELFRGEVGDLTEKTKLENKPYIAYSTKLGKVAYTVVPKLQPDNEIWYTTVDGSVANFNDNYCNTTLMSNTYKNGLGVAKFKDPLIKIWGDMDSQPQGEYFEVSYWGFAGGTRIETIFLPNKLETIDAYAFNYHYVGFPTRESADVEYLREITLGNNINTLDYSPNYGDSLQKTIYKGDVSDYCKINIISSPVSYSHNLYINDVLLTDLIVPDDVFELKPMVFKSCESLNSLTLHKNVQTIGTSAFEGCTGLTTIDLKNVQTIGDSAFEGCTSLISIDSANVQTVGKSAFKGCTGLTAINLKNVQTIGDSTFEGCTSLISIDSANVQTVGDNAFYGCTSLTSIDLTNVQTIGDNAFYGCTSLNSLTIPSTVISISSNAFKGTYIQSSNFVNNSSLDAEANNYWGATIYDQKTEDGLYIKDTTIVAGEHGGELNIPTYVTKIGSAALSNHIMSLTYNDTIENWRKIEKYNDSYYDENTQKYIRYEYGYGDREGTQWDYESRTDGGDENYHIYVTCTDGVVEECGRYWA